MLRAGLSYGVMEERELPAVARMLSHAFGGELDRSAEWLRRVGLEHVRVLRDGGAAAATLTRIPMGQRFGGRSIGMMGIAGVAVPPELRGRGYAREMMAEEIRREGAEGVPLSTLYASTQALYRQVGYEQAGHRCQISIPLAKIGLRERGGEIRQLTGDDDAAVRACYERFSAMCDGALDRSDYMWARVKQQVGRDAYHGFGVAAEGGGGGGAAGELDGYVFVHQRRHADSGRLDLILSDVAFVTAAAGRRLLGFLADFTSMGDEATLFGGPWHPILALLPQQRYTVRLKDYWMLRVCDVRRAIESRGYASAVTADVQLRVRDETLESNSGAWRVRVSGGRAECARVEDAGRRAADARAVVCSERGLAAMFAGLMTPAQARLAGLVDESSDAAAMEALGAAFAGMGTPWMSDMF